MPAAARDLIDVIDIFSWRQGQSETPGRRGRRGSAPPRTLLLLLHAWGARLLRGSARGGIYITATRQRHRVPFFSIVFTAIIR
eukprot:COSAG01_NODE_4579_length_4904_cov_13.838710_8_plen_83_part_00